MAFSKKFFGYFVLLFLVLSFHIWIFNKIPLQFDELLMFENIKNLNYSNLLKYLMNVEIQMPLAYFLLKIIRELIGEQSYLLRLPSLLILFLIPWPFYKLSRYSLSRSNSFKAVILLLMFHPVFIFSGSMRPYLMLMFFAILILLELRILLGNHFSSTNTQKFRVMLVLICLSVTHPIGFVLALSFLLLVLGQKSFSRKKRLFFGAAITLFVCSVVSFRYYSILHIFKSKSDVFSVFEYVKNLSYLTSGGGFSAALILLFLSFIGIQFKKKTLGKEFDKLHLLVFLPPLVGGAILVIVLNKYLYPRHFIFCLPSLAILTIQLINSVVGSAKIKNAVYSLLLAALIHKTFFRESLWSRSYEIDSLAISQKASELAEGKLRIISCGNCFSYYLKNSNLECIGGHLDNSFLSGMDKDLIFISASFSKESCREKSLRDHFKIISENHFIGGSVYKIGPL